MTNKRVRIRDRRVAPRHAVGLELTVLRPKGVVVGGGPGPFEGHCLDISQSGLRFSSREIFARREHLTITIYDGGGFAGLRVVAEVVRSQRVSGGYETGCRFLETLPLQE